MHDFELMAFGSSVTDGLLARRSVRGGFPIPETLADHHRVGEVAMLQIDVGEEFIVKVRKQFLEILLPESGAFEENHRAGDTGIRQVVQIDGGDILAVPLGEEAFGGLGAERAFPGNRHGREGDLELRPASARSRARWRGPRGGLRSGRGSRYDSRGHFPGR